MKEKRGGKRPNAGRKPRGVSVYMHLNPAVLHLLEKLQGVLNEKLKGRKRKPLRLSEVVAVVVTDAVLHNAGDLQEESREMGLHRIAVQLAPLFGADGLAASGLPELPDGAGARRFNRNKLLL